MVSLMLPSLLHTDCYGFLHSLLSSQQRFQGNHDVASLSDTTE